MTSQRQKGLVIALVMLIAVGLAVTAPAKAAPISYFTGVWEATDIDGSHMRMVITGSGYAGHKFRWTDSSWSICGDTRSGLGKGIGELDGDPPSPLLHGSWDIYCSGSFVLSVSFDLVYNAVDDSMDTVGSPGGETHWTRVR
jgi:hypothetical protein